MRERPADGKAALRLLRLIAHAAAERIDPAALAPLLAADLVTRRKDGSVALTEAGRAFLARAALMQSGAEVDAYLGQHLALRRATVDSAAGPLAVLVDEAESPLAWLARRKGKNGRPLIEPSQLQAGERLRADFTRAQLTPRVTSNWSSPAAQGRSGRTRGAAAMTDAIVAARQRFARAMRAVGPEFAGLLTDVCCFLKGIEDVERERGWPARSGKVVLQLGLDRLARHYGLAEEARGLPRAPMRRWTASQEQSAGEIG
jgi:hypothetical protein